MLDTSGSGFHVACTYQFLCLQEGPPIPIPYGFACCLYLLWTLPSRSTYRVYCVVSLKPEALAEVEKVNCFYGMDLSQDGGGRSRATVAQTPWPIGTLKYLEIEIKK